MILKVGRAAITHDVLGFIRPVPILLRNVLYLICRPRPTAWTAWAFGQVVLRLHGAVQAVVAHHTTTAPFAL